MPSVRLRMGGPDDLPRQATRVLLLAVTAACVWLLSLCVTWAGDDLNEVQGVAGVVVVNGVGVQGELELFRVGDFDPSYATRRFVVREPDTLVNTFALDWGAMPDDDARRVRTDAQGRFSLGMLEAGGYVLWARDASGRLGHRSWEVRVSGAREFLEIPLSTGTHTLKARVLRRGTEPHVGPVVVVRCYDSGGRYAWGRARTDAEGRLAVPGLPATDVRLVAVTAEGAVALSPPYRVPSAAEVAWTLALPDADEVRGRVLAREGDAPVNGAWVEAVMHGPSESLYARSLRAGPEGRFAIPMPDGAVSIRTFAPGFESGHAQLRDGRGEVTLKLARERVVRGRVVKKETTQGVAGVRVFAHMLDLGGRNTHEAVTDDQGRFELRGMRATEWMVFAQGHGWVSDGLWNVAWETFNPFALKLGEGTTADRTLEVVAAGTLEGIVVDDAGHPVPGVVVNPDLRSTPASDERPLWAYAKAREVVSGADGTFRHDGLLPGGMYAFKVNTPGFPETESAPIVIKPGPQGQRLNLVLSRKRWVRVRVTDSATGQPVAGASVRPAIVKRWGADTLEWSRTTDGDGAARLGPLPEGEVGLYVDAEEYEHPGEDALPVLPKFVGSDADVLAVPLVPGRTITGRVRLPGDIPALGLEVEAYSIPGRGSHPSPVRTCPLAEDGSFRLRGLRAAKYAIVVRREVAGGTWAGHTKLAAPATDVTLSMTFHAEERPAAAEQPKAPPDLHAGQHRIRVRVTTHRGEPLRAGNVRVHPEQLNSSFRVLDGAALVAVPRGAEKIWLEFPGGHGWDPGHGGGYYGPFDAKLEEISVALTAARSVSFRVLTPEGKGLAGVRASVLPLNPAQPGMPERYLFQYSFFEAYTDGTGRCEIAGLGTGEHALRLAVPPEFVLDDLRKLTLPSDEVTVTLRRGVVVDVQVLDDAGKPFAGAQVQARRLEGEGDKEHWELMSQAYTGPDGVAHLQGLAADLLYRLGVYPSSDLRKDLQDVKVHDWKPATTTVQLKKE